MGYFLLFSDAAKYADVARNLFFDQGYVTTFSFFFKPYFVGTWIAPVMPFSILAFFKLFGVNDFAVIATSFFYFILILFFVFLLASKVYKSKLIGFLSMIAVGFNRDLINYATSGASETPFIFEIVAACYFVTLKKTWGNFATIFILFLMYFTRPQAFIYIAGVILYYMLLNFKVKKALTYFGIVVFLSLCLDQFVLTPLSGNYFIYSILGRGSNVLSQVAVGQSASDQLRSGVLTYNFSVLESLKKVFYNLYNFYKLLPQILNPFLFTVFILGLFYKTNWELKVSTKFMLILTLVVVAASIPFFRYIHPAVPLIYIVAIGSLVEILGFSIKNYDTNINKHLFVKCASILLVLFFSIGQTLGVLLLDSRFERKLHNIGAPPVYVGLSRLLNKNTNNDQVIVTNLDTWGSWYGERKTIWFPIEPKQMIDRESEKIPFDAIFLTSYLINDENYKMGESWRLIYDNPLNPEKWTCDGCDVIAKEFVLKGVYNVKSDENYERQDARAVLLIKK